MKDNKLNIALIGYGKMGHIIEKVAIGRGHRVGLAINSSNKKDMTAANLSDIDVAIEFTSPKAAVQNLKILASAGITTICGTTGWLDDYDEITKAYAETDTGFLYASNFSIGVNVFFAINKQLAKLMAGHKDYGVAMTESHHITKVDAPSGTAVSLANQILGSRKDMEGWQLDGASSTASDSKIPIKAIREKDVKGMHEIRYSSSIDEITIRHEAFSREGFALGAVLAAEYMNQRTGIHTMDQVLNL